MRTLFWCICFTFLSCELSINPKNTVENSNIYSVKEGYELFNEIRFSNDYSKFEELLADPPQPKFIDSKKTIDSTKYLYIIDACDSLNFHFIDQDTLDVISQIKNVTGKKFNFSKLISEPRENEIDSIEEDKLYLSAPIFNKSKNLASFNFYLWCGSLCATHSTYFCKKVNGKWKIICDQMNSES